jgi:hypothetical protein
MGRPRRIAQSGSLVARSEFEQALKRASSIIHRSVRVADFRKTLRNGQHREVGRIAFSDFVPAQRRGYARIRQRSY